MPPAFNLSRDQTLQFNLCVVPRSCLRKPRSFERSLTQKTDWLRPKTKPNMFTVRALITCARRPRSSASRIKRPHLSAVCLLKNSRDSLCLPRRQQQRNEIMKNFLRFVNRFEASFRFGQSRLQHHPPSLPTPQPASLLALPPRFVLRGANSRPVRPPWQDLHEEILTASRGRPAGTPTLTARPMPRSG